MSRNGELRSPTRTSTAIFLGKAALLQLQRAAQNAAQSTRRHPQRTDSVFSKALAACSTPLWTDTNPTEAWYQRGKIQNLRLAASRLHLCVIPAGEVFSFWQQVGRATKRKGYARGRMLQEGCMIPAVGGGLCQLSNALYQIALDAGCEILERHSHSRIVPGSATAVGRDATVAWNYIDLRFCSQVAMQLRVLLTATDLLVSLHAAETHEAAIASPRPGKAAPLKAPGIFADHACESCGNVSCFRHSPSPVKLGTRTVTAFLLDAAWPEFKSYIAAHHAATDLLAVPLDGARWKKPQYEWPKEGFAEYRTATLSTLIRAAKSRQLAAQGAARQRALLDGAAALARELAKSLSPNVDQVCVSQSLLPFLWHSGVLGGRRIRVLMTQLPMRMLEATLDRAYKLHPESWTLRDFRAERWLVDAEEEALSHAEQIVTPHAYVASSFAAKSVLLDWSMPVSDRVKEQSGSNRVFTVLFPASTLGRKGAYELREALRGLDVKLLLAGKMLEDEHFWDGFNVAHVEAAGLSSVDLVVLPAVVESQPRSLLRVLSAGIPVITTRESGLHPGCGAQWVDALDTDGLKAAIELQIGSPTVRSGS